MKRSNICKQISSEIFFIHKQNQIAKKKKSLLNRKFLQNEMAIQ